ncbi:MAG: restriction endonuclease [Acidobacteriia bacterium]|nr:restriction endonuclease [Terriglobia bacterium]
MDLVNARPAKDHKKGADTGIDGYINFFDDPDTIRRGGKAKQVIVQVKSGYVGVNHVRDLNGVIEPEKSVARRIITLREPTKPMLTEAAAAGFYESKDFPGRYPRVAVTLSAAKGSRHFLAKCGDSSLPLRMTTMGKKLEYPAHRVETFAKAERKMKNERAQLF